MEIAALRPAFADAGLDLLEIDWRAPIEAFDGLSLVLLGTAWDYQDHPDEFLARLEALEARGIAVCNPPEIVRWNSNKRYLQELSEAGTTIVPTLWRDDADAADVAAALAAFDSDSVVVKRQVGAGGIGQLRFGTDSMPDEDWRMGHACMIQPFLPSVVEEGEYTFLFIDGTFNHGVLKRAARGEYRIQSLYGGYEMEFTPSAPDLAAARAVIEALPFDAPLYCRIDMVRLPTSELAVMEAEMIEPYLYPEQGPRLGEMLSTALLKRLG